METINAQMNYGKWIAICPRCAAQGLTAAMEILPGALFVCPEENPDLLATTLIPNPRMQGAFISVPDLLLREETHRAAVAAGSAFEVVFPPEKEEIERLLRRRSLPNRNWIDGTLDELRRGNAEQGLSYA